MTRNVEHGSDWGVSFSYMVWRRFVKGRFNVACLTFIIILILIAILAPFIANDKPYAIRISGQWRFPLFAGFQRGDYCYFILGIAGLWNLVQLGRKNKRFGHFASGDFIWRSLSTNSAVVLLGCSLVFVFVQPDIDGTDYKALIASGQASNAIFAPVPYCYEGTDIRSRLQPPSKKHWLGTDDVGADVLCRLIHGSRISISVGFVAVGISSIIGIVIGAFLGYFGGKIDFIGMRLVEMVMAIPVFFLIITMIAFFPRNLYIIMVIIGITSWTGNARLIRAEFLKLRKQDFVQAALSLGLPLRRVIFKHMLPNGITPVLVNATFGISGAIFIEAALSFLGFGAVPSTPSWGQMLSSGVSTTGNFLWWLTLFPGLAIFLTVLAYNMLGQGLRDALDIRLKKKV